jgi:hypothetical protein
MSSILYYSNYCQHSKKLLETVSKSPVAHKDIHFICIDRREKGPNNKTYIVLDNGQKIIMPENVSRVPALLLLNQGYNVLYGDAIIQHIKPRQEIEVKKATQNNMEPMAFSFSGGGFGDVVSDSYSFLDQNPEDLQAKGNGGTRQMHNYVDLNYSSSISTPADDFDYKNANKVPSDLTIEKLQEQRNNELQQLTGGNKRPII